MPINALLAQLPAYAHDIATNLAVLAEEDVLSDQARWGCFVASACAVGEPETLAARRRDAEAPLVALQPAQIDESRQQGPAQDAGDVRAVFGGVQVIPDWLATGGDRYAQRLEEGRPG